MKKIIVLLLLVSSTLFAVVDERKSDIYYGNGIMTTKKEAKTSLIDVIKPAVQETIYFNDQAKMDKLHTFDLVYNYSAKEDFNDTLVAQALDLAESYEQLGNTSLAWATMSLLTDIVQGYSKILKWPVKKVAKYLVEKKGFSKAAAELLADKIVGASKATLIAMAEKLADYNAEEIHDNDLKEMVAKYTQSIYDGHGVIMVTHSQGNLFAVESKNSFGEGKEWMRDYLYHVSIASPATSFASDHHWLVSLDNDVVANIPSSVGTNMRNPVRYFSYYLDGVDPYMPESWVDNSELLDQTIGQMLLSEGYWIDGFTPPSESRTITENMTDYTVRMEPDEWDFLQTDFHAFNYYMGVTSFQAYISKIQTVKQKSDATKDTIIYSIAAAIESFNDTSSQWQTAKTTGCGCDKRIEVEHKFDSNLSQLMQDLDVLPFDESGKLYPLGFDYVKGSPKGETVSSPGTDTICFELLDDSEVIVGSITSTSGGSVTPKPGVVTVALNWEDADIDLNLDVRWDAGEHDIKDVSCSPTEHFYIESAYSIYPGRYAVYVDHSGDVDNSLLPETVQIGIKVPGEYQSYTLNVTSSDELNIGHVADINIEYIDGNIVVETVPTTYVRESFNNHTVRTNDDEEEDEEDEEEEEDDGGRGIGGYIYYYGGGTPVAGCYESCGCIPCQYTIIPYLQQVVMGPLGGADVTLHTASEFGNASTPILTTSTSTGNTLYTAGLVDMNETFKATLDDNELYIFSVSGGSDIDANDDFAIDAIATENRGTVHAVLTGREIKDVGFKVNIMTEIAYQVTKEMYGGGASNEEILAKLDEVATLLLRDKIYSNSAVPLGHTDLLVWLPTIDRELLFVEYVPSIQPIINSIYNNEDIYDAAYNVVYFPNGVAVGAPRLTSSILRVNEHAPMGTIVGSVSVYSEGDSSISSMTLSGEGSENFVLANNGIISVSASAALDYEQQQIYKLSVTATNANGVSSPVNLYVQLNNIVDVPVATSFTGYQVLDTAEAGTLVGVLTFNEGAAPVNLIQLFGEGSEYFEIDIEGRITVGADGFSGLNELLDDDGEKTSFSLSIVAANALGDSMPVQLGLEVYHVQAAPTLIPLHVNVDESTQAFNVIGSIDFNEGNSPVSEFVLSGIGNENFTIDLNGQIAVAEGTVLDYETTTVYRLESIATNAYGSSQSTSVTIYVQDLPEVPTAQAFSASVINQAESGTIVGTLVVHDNGDPITSVQLSGEGHEDFRVDNNGVITVSQTANLDYTVRSEYMLAAQAINSQGVSPSVEVAIRVTSFLHTGHVDPFSDQSAIIIHTLDDLLSLQGTELTGVPLFSDVSKFGRSVYFDSSRGCVDFSSTTVGDFTMSAWVKPQQTIQLISMSTSGTTYYSSGSQSEVFYPTHGGTSS
ncbi:hypothetical protein, partial [Sulfurovum sp.]|uniref:hypothetical protein n=1 Tax=Sulfurovum sp. TaxID=1969726 RepID=UPI003567663F